jgi:hypothetical protein
MNPGAGLVRAAPPTIRQIWAVMVLRNGVEQVARHRGVLLLTDQRTFAGQLLALAREHGQPETYLVCFPRAEESPR